METLTMAVSPELQTLIDTRLDLVDRVLVDARVSRTERTGILQELEAQILEQLERRSSQPTREDLLAVLAELDPPEAFLADEAIAVASAAERSRASHARSAMMAGARESARPTQPGGLSLWAGALVAGVSLTTALLMTILVWIAPEVVLLLVAVLQVPALVGAALGGASLLRSGARVSTSLERTVAGVAAATGLLTVAFLAQLAFLFVGEFDAEFAVYVLAGFVGGAWVHGAWLGAATCALWMRQAQ